MDSSGKAADTHWMDNRNNVEKTSIAAPSLNEHLLTYTADPGAHFTIQNSPNLVTWTDEGSVLSVNQTNTVTVTTNLGADKRFWQMKRI